MPHDTYRPRARAEGVLAQTLGEELLVFDSDRSRAHSLNVTAARVWHACDGQRDLTALQEHCQLDLATVELALDRLRANHLLDEADAPDLVSRRAMLRRTAIAGASAGVAVPIIRSITAPTTAMAITTTCVGPNGTCGPGPASRCCSPSVCNALHECVGSCESSGGFCSGSGVCCSGYLCIGSRASSHCLPTG